MMENVYKFKPKEQVILRNNKPSNSADWGKSIYANIKANIKDHLAKINDQRCFYCKCELSGGCSISHIEHIVDKNRHPQFMFDSQNLTLACPICNSSKSTTNVLKKLDCPNIYPTDKEDYKIIHAYLDKYEEHIEMIKDIFFRAKNGSIKGSNTIEICNLTRHRLAEEKVKELCCEKMLGTGEDMVILECGIARKQASFKYTENVYIDEYYDSLYISRIIRTINKSNEFVNAYDLMNKNNRISNLSDRISINDLMRLEPFFNNIQIIMMIHKLIDLINGERRLNRQILNYIENCNSSNDLYSNNLKKAIMLLEIIYKCNIKEGIEIFKEVNSKPYIKGLCKKIIAKLESFDDIYLIMNDLVKTAPSITLMYFILYNKTLTRLISTISDLDIKQVEICISKIKNIEKYDYYAKNIIKIINIYKLIDGLDHKKAKNYIDVINKLVSSDIT